MSLQVVWFKRDLRITDHEALFRACTAGPTICLYVIEPAYWELNNTSNRQWLFVRESLMDLREQLVSIGGQLLVVQGSVTEILSQIVRVAGAFTLHSHIETGIRWTFERDKRVARWCRDNHCVWLEYAQNGVCRPLAARMTGFQEHWNRWVQTPRFPRPLNATFVDPDQTGVVGLPVSEWPIEVCTDRYLCPGRQVGGRKAALDVFRSFLLERGETYRGSISSPLSAESSCSRLSPYIAYGCLSLREVVQRTAVAHAQAGTARWSKSLTGFMTRLHWHCYWIQSFETVCHMEQEPLVSEMARLNRPFDQVRFDAWTAGRTGWPMVDACMRFLHHNGWINFRMRAMLVCAATHSLELPWQPVADWMAQMFVDFEPGIHYPQIQLQSAMSGGSVVRMYNPVTQATTLDPEGVFVRRWVPELANVSQYWIFEPWKMTEVLRERVGWTGTLQYPLPIVDFAQTHRATKAAITEIRAEHDLVPAPRFHERRSKSRQQAERVEARANPVGASQGSDPDSSQNVSQEQKTSKKQAGRTASVMIGKQPTVNRRKRTAKSIPDGPVQLTLF